jgi:CBS domain-containing protein
MLFLFPLPKPFLDVEKAIGVAPIETVSIHPDRPVYEACQRILASRARRIPLVDIDDETKRATVVSVITQYRILKFIAVNVTETQFLRKPLKHLNVGTYTSLQTAYIDTPVIDVIHQLVHSNISCVPILTSDGMYIRDPLRSQLTDTGVVVNVFEAVDVITLIKDGNYYEDLSLTVGEALQRRPDVSSCALLHLS